MSYKQISSEYGNAIVRLTLPMNMGLMYRILFVQHGFESLNFYRECRSSLALLPVRNFAVFVRDSVSFHITPIEQQI